MALTAEMLVRLSATQSGSHDYGGPTLTPKMESRMQLGSGTTAGNADILFMDQRSVASDTNDDIDLAGALSNAFGATITAAELVGIFIVNAPISGAANTTALTVGAGSAPVTGFMGGTTPTIGPIQPGGFVALGAGHASGLGAVTANTADILRIGNASGAAATYQIAILARSA